MSKQSLRTLQEDEFLKTARSFARAKLFKQSIENNRVNLLCDTDARDLAEYFRKQLEFQAIQLLAAMSVDDVDGQIQP